MRHVENLLTENIDIWSSAVKAKNTQGRGSSKKIELYGIKKLRELILELAVRGLLVPQNANDEPASVLLKKIAAEKNKLEKSKKIKKAKLAKENEMPMVSFDYPQGWELPYLNDLIINGSDNIVDGPFGSRLKATEYVESGIPIIRIQNIDRNTFKNTGIQYLTKEKADELKRHSFISGDIVLNKLGEPTGKVCIVPEELKHGIIVADIIRVRVEEGFHDKQFLVHCMNSPFLARQFEGLAKGVTRQRVNLSQVRSLKIPLPPKNEQERIVNRVDELMALCDQLEQQQESSITAHQTLVETLLVTLTNAGDKGSFKQAWARIAEHFDSLFTTEWSIDQLKQTILQLAVMGKLVPQNPNDEPASQLLKKIATEKAKLIKEGKIKKQKPLPPISEDEKPFELPVGWGYTRLDDICGWITSGTTPPKSDFHESEGVPYLKVYNIRNQSIDFDYKQQFITPECHKTKQKRSILYPGDVVMNIVGPPLGKIAIIPNKYPEWNCNQAIVFFRPLEIKINSYLYTYLTAQIFLNYIELIGTAGQDNISVTKSRTIVFPLPPLKEQHRIVAKVDELMALCDQLKANLNNAQTTQLQLADAMAEQALS